jgi:hypothetical protein
VQGALDLKPHYTPGMGANHLDLKMFMVLELVASPPGRRTPTVAELAVSLPDHRTPTVEAMADGHLGLTMPMELGDQ